MPPSERLVERIGRGAFGEVHGRATSSVRISADRRIGAPRTTGSRSTRTAVVSKGLSVMTTSFGSCCSDLRQAMTEPPNSMFRVEKNGVLFLSVGYAQVTSGQVGWFDSAVMFCPFCGATLQTRDEVMAIMRAHGPPDELPRA